MSTQTITTTTSTPQSFSTIKTLSSSPLIIKKDFIPNFNVNSDAFKVKLYLAFGATIPADKLIDAIQGTKQLLKKE